MTYAAQVARLAEVFPRGRFKRDLDGTAILVPRSRRWAGCHLYEQAPRRLVGLFYVGSPRKVTGRLAAYLVKHLAGDGEGIVHLRWDPELARVLPTFSLGAQRGTRSFRKRGEATATADLGAQEPPGAGDRPPEAPGQGAGSLPRT